MTESSAALICHHVIKTYGQCALLISLPLRLGSFSLLSSPRLALTRIGSLLLLDLLQASQQRVNLDLDLSQLPFNSLKLVRLYC